jgi:hypothetical protein
VAWLPPSCPTLSELHRRCAATLIPVAGPDATAAALESPVPDHDDTVSGRQWPVRPDTAKACCAFSRRCPSPLAPVPSDMSYSIDGARDHEHGRPNACIPHVSPSGRIPQTQLWMLQRKSVPTVTFDFGSLIEVSSIEADWRIGAMEVAWRLRPCLRLRMPSWMPPRNELGGYVR